MFNNEYYDFLDKAFNFFDKRINESNWVYEKKPSNCCDNNNENYGKNYNIYIPEDGESEIITIELPGLNKEDILVSLRDCVIIVESKNKNDKNYFKLEFLVKKTDVESIEAEMQNGLLKIKIPFPKEFLDRKKKKTIKVK